MSKQEEEIINYAIPGNDEGGRLFVYGKKDAKHTVLFCAGFPDDCSTFLPLAQRLSSDCNCLCGVTCMPGYDTHDNLKPQGYTFDEVVASLREATKTLRALSTNTSAQLTGIFHDWGSLVGAMCATRMNKEVAGYFSKLVYFDVLPPVPESSNVKEAKNLKKSLVSAAYSTVLASSFAIQRFLSFYVAAPVCLIGFTMLGLLRLTPTGPIDAAIFEKREPKLALRKMLYMAYPYFYMYKAMILGQGQSAGCNLPSDLDETPVLYMYGTEKNIQFHDDNHLVWLKKEAAKKDSKTRVVAVDKAGHWLYLQQPDTCYENVKSFIFES